MTETGDNLFDPNDTLRGGPHLPPHLYVHVPFCRMKCSYCDFYSVDDISGERIEAVLRGIEGEIAQWGALGLPGVIETIYIGGGTPTIITGGVLRILDAVRSHFPVRAGAEVTVEANPDSATPALIEAFAAAGVTRVSMGVQSFVESEIGLLGRVHTVDEAVNACKAVRAAGLDLAVDLMCGVPGQSKTSWMTSLEQAVLTGADHVSVYPLTLEEGTPLEVAVGTGLVPEPDPDRAAEQMIIAEEFLGMADIVRYEVANYAREGHESRHNIAYWTGGSYVGVGPAAYSMLDAPTAAIAGLADATDTSVARVRFGNARDIEGWLVEDSIDVEALDESEARREDVMLGLRLVRGVPHTQVLDAGVEGALAELEDEGLVERVTPGGAVVLEAGVVPGMRWRTTRQGWLLGNEVFGRVLEP